MNLSDIRYTFSASIEDDMVTFITRDNVLETDAAVNIFVIDHGIKTFVYNGTAISPKRGTPQCFDLSMVPGNYIDQGYTISYTRFGSARDEHK